MCLSHSSSLRSGKSVRNCAPRDSLRSIAADDGRLGAVEHVPELESPEHVLVEHRAAVVDPRRLRVLLEAVDDLQAGLQPFLVTEDGGVVVHRDAELVLDLGYAPAAVLARDDRVDLVDVALELWHPVDLRHAHRLGAFGRVLAGPPPEDERVEQRVRAEPVAAVYRDAGDLAGRVQPRIDVWPLMSVLTPPMM